MDAVIFDVDGTLVDSERDGHRVAFNRAFEEAGLSYRWDVESYGELLRLTGGQRRIAAYLREQGCSADEAECMARRLHSRKTEIFTEMASRGEIQLRPGVAELVEELTAAGIRLAIATTGSARWVHALLARWFAGDRFEVVLTSAEAPTLKPDPAAYELALRRLGSSVTDVVAIEDSSNGLRAAKAAGLLCVVVVNDYTRMQDFADADLVLDGFGAPGAAARSMADPHGVAPRGRLDLATLERLTSLPAAGHTRVTGS